MCTREVRSATPAAGGQCGNAGGTPSGWTIEWVRGGRRGGRSELSDAGSSSAGAPLVRGLRRTATVHDM
ncbi:hypothetical protein [Massilia eurypsychrophila]|nr:hypothetical protein [Massilia eurypsychrophila]